MHLMVILAMLFSTLSFAQTEPGITIADVQKLVDEKLASKWYEKLSLRGYAQFRYNRLAETNRDLNCQSCDRSIGDRQGFFMRRARLIISGQVHDRVFVYIQPDYASDATSQNYFQMRDAYFDYGLTASNEWRIRSGLSKLPFGFENLQSSSNRAPLDRADALNTAAPNERDIGVFLMYAPTEMRKLFRELSTANNKGSGDYGLISIGAYNGQTLNRRERNNDLHRIVRLTYPHKFANGQIVEASIQAYEGKFFVEKATGSTAGNLDRDFYDGRQALTFVLYPKPFGIQAEWNQGRGPTFSRAQNKVVTDDLSGGYVIASYQIEQGANRYFPFVRWQEFEGGRKIENAAFGRVREWEIGTEWQPNAAFELTASYVISDRLIQSQLSNRYHEQGNLIRLQAQFNY
jgi:hypothetical protein